MKIGYARVSTKKQRLDLQLIALEKAGCEKIITDTKTGMSVDRPGWKELNMILRPGDTLVVYKLDRLGRPAIQTAAYVAELGERGINFVSLTNDIDTTTPIGKFAFHVSCCFAELERDYIVERTRAGLEAAKEKGNFGGRRNILTSKQAEALRDMHKSDKYTGKEIARIFNISRQTVYRYLRDHKKPV